MVNGTLHSHDWKVLCSNPIVVHAALMEINLLSRSMMGSALGVSQYITIHKKFISYRNMKCVSQYIVTSPSIFLTVPFSFISYLVAIEVQKKHVCGIYKPLSDSYQMSSNRHMCMCIILIFVRKVQN